MLKVGSKNQDKVVALGTVQVGQVFRFSATSFADALANGTFYARTNPNNGEKRVSVVGVDFKEHRLFDPEHLVVVHEYDIIIYPS